LTIATVDATRRTGRVDRRDHALHAIDIDVDVDSLRLNRDRARAELEPRS
jgi:hypothetical protein